MEVIQKMNSRDKKKFINIFTKKQVENKKKSKKQIEKEKRPPSNHNHFYIYQPKGKKIKNYE